MKKTYNLSSEQLSLINMAIELNKPMLISGKPGTGKTQMAYSFIEKNLHDFKNVFQFNTKSMSGYKDLLYRYDALEHFRDTQIKASNTEANPTSRGAESFIYLEPLGKAIVLAVGITQPQFESEKWKTIFNNTFGTKDSEAIGISGNKNIVLIDEIDKAPRDFPNDLLNELDNFEFSIPEIQEKISLRDRDKDLLKNILVLITTNDEKNLPDAFLRRCLFYHIEITPDKLKEIVKAKLDELNLDLKSHNRSETWLETKLNILTSILNSSAIEKKPSTAECIEWIAWYSQLKDDKATIKLSQEETQELSKEETLHLSLNILLKKQSDVDKAKALFIK